MLASRPRNHLDRVGIASGTKTYLNSGVLLIVQGGVGETEEQKSTLKADTACTVSFATEYTATQKTAAAAPSCQSNDRVNLAQTRLTKSRGQKMVATFLDRCARSLPVHRVLVRLAIDAR